MNSEGKVKFFIIAGEPSGDLHAASLIKEIKMVMPDASFYGIGGGNMLLAGLHAIHDISEMAVMGFAEVIKKYSFFQKVYNHAIGFIKKEKPDAIILVDYPGFNLRFAADAHKMGIKTIYYICPQVWAWHQSRIKQMSRDIDLLITIFPFEKKIFENTNLQVEFVGHPLVDIIAEERKMPSPNIPWNGKKRLALLPGSRQQEVERILPPLLAAVRLLENEMSDIGSIVASPSEKITAAIHKIAQNAKFLPSRWNVATGITRRVLTQADAAFVASGTATVETALLGCPMVVTYKMSLLSYLFARLVIKVPHIGMVNIIADRKLCPELIQYNATPSKLAKAILPFLSDTAERKIVIEGLREVSQKLGLGGAAKKAAEIIKNTFFT